MTTDYALFDASSYLDSDEMIAEYLTAAAEDDDPNVLLAALADVAKARGMKQVAEAAGLGRESLYKTLAPGAHPRMSTVRAILRALNVRLTIKASPPSPAVKKRKPITSVTAAEQAARKAAAKKAAPKKARAEAAKRATPAKKRA
jgi:probable addiction module antidote protein